MISLTTTTDTLQVVLAEAESVANSSNYYVGFFSDTGAGITEGRQISKSSGAGTVTILSAPSGTDKREAHTINIYNGDTINHAYTLRYNDSLTPTTSDFWRVILQPRETAVYSKANGWEFRDSFGSLKGTTSGYYTPVSNTYQEVFLGSNVINNNAVANTIQDITGLSFPVVANTGYYFRFVIHYDAAATTTGARFSISGPASPSLLDYRSVNTLTTTSQTFNEGLNAYDLPAASNATSVLVGNIAIVEGWIVPTVNGTVIARFASEIANSAITAKAGSFVMYRSY